MVELGLKYGSDPYWLYDADPDVRREVLALHVHKGQQLLAAQERARPHVAAGYNVTGTSEAKTRLAAFQVH